MKSRNWVFLFFSTLLLGTVSAIIVGLIMKFPDGGGIRGLSLYILGLVGFGALFSVFSQMGFFAYLTVHRFGLGIFKSHSLWSGVQLLLIGFVVFDLFYLRYTAFHQTGESIVNYVGIPVLIFCYSLIVAFIKQKMTNKIAFVPTLFFLVVVTTFEWVPVLKENKSLALWMSFIPLMVCNTYQILVLHRLNQPKSPSVSA